MTFAKTLSTLSLAFALQAGAFIAAAVVLSPSDAAAAGTAKKQNKTQKKSAARINLNSMDNQVLMNEKEQPDNSRNLARIQAELARKMKNHKSNSSLIRAVGDSEQQHSRNMN
jgi:hypothetical protein